MHCAWLWSYVWHREGPEAARNSVRCCCGGGVKSNDKGYMTKHSEQASSLPPLPLSSLQTAQIGRTLRLSSDMLLSLRCRWQCGCHRARLVVMLYLHWKWLQSNCPCYCVPFPPHCLVQFLAHTFCVVFSTIHFTAPQCATAGSITWSPPRQQRRHLRRRPRPRQVPISP
jgi:hypothetical protein